MRTELRPSVRSLVTGQVRLDLDDERLFREGRPVKLGYKPFLVMKTLMSAPGVLISKEELLETVWSGAVVTDAVLTTAVKELRSVLGDDARKPRFIETVHGRGYRYLPQVEIVDASADGRGGRPGAPADAPLSIAVLPLKNFSGDPEQSYFVAGMQDALIADLSKIGALKVISRTSTRRYRDTEKSLPQIGAELGVDTLVEGSVYRVGDKVRVTVQLMDARTDDHIWAEHYERDLTDVLVLQSELARAIAEQIEITVTPEEEARLADARKVDPEIYNAYLRGMYFANKSTPEETAKGLETLHATVETDPTSALAWAGLGLAHLQAAHGPEPPLGAYEKAKVAANKALALDDGLAEAYAARAEGRLYSDWDWEGARADFHQALHLNTSLAATRAHYSWSLNLFGHNEAALRQMERAIEIDPLTPLWPAWLAWQHWEIGQPELAVHHARKSLELDRNFPVGLYVLGGALAVTGAFEEAIAAHESAAAISPEWDLGLAEDYALAGREPEARAALARMEDGFTTWDTYFIARGYLALGDLDGTFEWLETAVDEPHHPYIPWIRNFVTYDPLRGDDRFRRLLRRMKLSDDRP